MIDIFLAILAAFFLASSVVDIRKGLQRMDYISCSMIITLIGLILLLPITAIFTDFHYINYGSTALFIIGGILSPGLVRLFFFKSIEKMGAVIMASIMPAQPIISALLAVLVLSEKPSIGLWIGILSIVVGATVIETSIIGNGKSRRVSLWLLLPITGIFFGGLSDLIRKISLNSFNQPLLGTAIANISSLLPFALMLALSKDPRESNTLTKKNFFLVWKGGLFMTIGWLLSFYALSYGNVTRVIPLVSSQPLFIFLIAHIYLKGIEKITVRPIIGALIMIAGIILFLFT